MSISEKIEENYDKLVSSLAEQRDELKLQIHLASMDVHDEWDEMEKKWEHLRGKGKLIKTQVGASAHDVGDAIAHLGEEIKKGYSNIRKTL